MTADPRLERALPRILADLGSGATPDYVDSLLARSAATRQRPGWVFPERWLPMSVVTSRVATAPPIRWRTLAVLALLIVGLVAGAVLVAGSQQRRLPAPYGPALNGQLIYSWMGDIYVRETLADEPQVLIGGDTEDLALGFSPDGTHLAFLRAVGERPNPLEGADEHDLWVARADGSGQKRIGGPFTECCWSEWSPSGDVIVVGSGVNGYGSIDLVRTDGSGTTRLDIGISAGFPTFRPPDGSQLLYRTSSNHEDAALWLANADGSQPVKLDLEGRTGRETFFDPAWSPTGDQLAFTSVDSVPGLSDGLGVRLQVATIGPAGEVSDQHGMPDDATADDIYAPQWLPDGQRLVFQRWQGVKESVHIVPADGNTAPADLGVVGSGGLRVTIAPDGEEVLVNSQSSYTLYRVDLDTMEAEKQFSTDEGAMYQRVAP